MAYSKLDKMISPFAPVEEPVCIFLTAGDVAGHQKIHISTRVTSAVPLDALSHSGLKETVLVDMRLLEKGFRLLHKFDPL